MSYEIILARVCGAEADSPRFKREVFEAIFLPHCSHLKSYRANPGSMGVEYPDGGGAQISIHNRSDEEEEARRRARTPEEHLALPTFPPGDRAYVEFLAFSRFGGDAFYHDLYTLLDRTDAMIYSGAIKEIVIVTKESVLKEIPEDFSGMENARIVRNAAELEAAIFAS